MSSIPVCPQTLFTHATLLSSDGNIKHITLDDLGAAGRIHNSMTEPASGCDLPQEDLPGEGGPPFTVHLQDPLPQDLPPQEESDIVEYYRKLITFEDNDEYTDEVRWIMIRDKKNL